MENQGLQSSRWARTAIHFRSGLHPSDWTCPSCGFVNFAWRRECFRCSHPLILNDGKTSAISQLEMTTLPLQQTTNNSVLSVEIGGNSSRANTHLVRPERITDDPLKDPNLYNGERGLATSRWAPRNQGARSRGAGADDVWTRIAPLHNSRSPSRSRATDSSRSNSLGLGLPYEVQHFILIMMQRILEEGTYAFASRWVPEDLKLRHWTCSEAVELSTWRNKLPEIIPEGALQLVPNYSLREGLRDAVEIRNAAAHRHLCDNTEIRKMASQAQNLMAIFSDVSRQEKFYRLRNQLSNWDAESREHLEVAQQKLQQVLQEINERPLNDMDWTPNTVSLRELTPDITPAHKEEDHNPDAMDLDL